MPSTHHLPPCLAPSLPTPHPAQVLVSDPKELEKIRERELDITRERIQKIIDAGGCGAGQGRKWNGVV